MARKKKERSLKLSYAVVGEGITEKIYFDRLKYHEDVSNFFIKPELPSDSDFSSIFNKADELLKSGIDRVYSIIDLDKIIDDGKSNEFNREKQKRKKTIKSKELIIILCNPCFEIWFLLHFAYTTKSFRNCSKTTDELKKHLKDYEKTKKYLEKKDIYKVLRPNLEAEAIPNSGKSMETLKSHHGVRRSYCQVHKIIEDLKIL